MGKRRCEIDGCERVHYAKGMCQLHWRRTRVTGDPHGKKDFRQTWRNRREADFWACVDKSGDCWEWTGVKQENGYGQFSMDGKTKLAHRVSMEFSKGPIRRGQWVLHRCDNPLCVRPDHLFLGSAADNTADMVAKRRHIHGSQHPLAKITESEAREIKKSSETLATVSKRYGISIAVASKIRRGVAWSHVEA